MSDYSEKLAKAKKIRDEKIAAAKKEYADEKRRLKAERDREKAAEKERKRQEKERAKAEKKRQKAAEKEKAKAEKGPSLLNKSKDFINGKVSRLLGTDKTDEQKAAEKERKRQEKERKAAAKERAKAEKERAKAEKKRAKAEKKEQNAAAKAKSEKTEVKEKAENKKNDLNKQSKETGSQTITQELLDDKGKLVGMDVKYPNGNKATYMLEKDAVATHIGRTVAYHKEGSSKRIDYVDYPDGKRDTYKYTDDKNYTVTHSDGTAHHYGENGIVAKTDKNGKVAYDVDKDGTVRSYDENQKLVTTADKFGNLLDDKGNVVSLANSDMLKNDLKAESEASRKAAELIIRREQEKMRKAAAEKQVATTEATPTDNKVVMRQMLRDHYER